MTVLEIPIPDLKLKSPQMGYQDHQYYFTNPQVDILLHTFKNVTTLLYILNLSTQFIISIKTF